MNKRYPIVWLTALTFSLVAFATRDWVIGGLILCIFLPLVLLCQNIIRWLGLRVGWSVTTRRVMMFLPAVVFASLLFIYTNARSAETAALKIALAGHVPEGIREQHVHEDAFTDYTVFAYIRCDSVSLRSILERPPFVLSSVRYDTYSFKKSVFPEIRPLPDVKGVFCYERTDLKSSNGMCYVYTDASFSFADIIYGVD